MQVIVLGDKTSHGGRVVTATSKITVAGKPAARVGDLVSCPKKGHGVNAIVQGSSVLFCSGMAIAVNGSLCKCGCVLIAGQSGFVSN